MARIVRTGWVGAVALVAASCPAGLAFAQGGGPSASPTPAYVPGEIIVKLKGQSRAQRSQAFIGKAVSQKAMSLKGSWSGLNLHHFAMKGQSGQPADVEQTLEQLRNDPDVEYAEPNYIFTRQSTGPESAPMTYDQMMAATAQAAADASASSSGGGFSAMAGGPTYTQSNAPISVQQAWGAMTSGLSAPVVAVIDTGLDLNNATFVNSGAIWTNSDEVAGNGVDDDGNGYVDDVHGWNFAYGNSVPQDDDGHGTHVSGIILGIAQDLKQNPIGAAKIKIMPLKFLDGNGSGTTSGAVQAIYYAVNNGATVLNNSWGGSGYSAALLDAINYSYVQHRLFVAAAGNAHANNDSTPTYPANFPVPNVISVAATSDSDLLASFSNYGALTVNLGGPGVSILSTLPNNTWGYESGTSMATPMVSGIAAMMVREKPGIWGYQVKSLMYSGLQQVSSLVGKTTTYGRVNAYNSVVAAKAATVSYSQPDYDPSVFKRSVASEGGVVEGGCGTVSKMMLDEGSMGDDDGERRAPSSATMAVLVAILLAPISVSLALRTRVARGRNQRKHERFQISSQVTLKLGERELVGSVSSISMGGAQVNAEAMLEKGGVVTMRISSPDGKDEIEVQGRVVWSEENKRYGVAFSETNEGVRSAIQRWTEGLVRG